ncbi:hypothetical protein EYZ11_003399 [Aspergillus tanneri]|uniref:Uncharacterized protein n=1 Tax=Aspergillus tanneri TaxID=1220188 RepID=A0A4S3JNC5_9EURO|nr:hypothetical protein EYZ11_003399 [Aspergillus tanneri]
MPDRLKELEVPFGVSLAEPHLPWNISRRNGSH